MGLERTFFLVMENVGVVEVCVNVSLLAHYTQNKLTTI